ncbi:zinc-dependent metalloprotease family protein [Longivirga aurantiaca]|uniref:Zinc-dependent metalloprotease family protein n=1 Tax=Longivirga aurantiaca TaxID=1837743 RepID=A0ABW1T383_9ACTN
MSGEDMGMAVRPWLVAAPGRAMPGRRGARRAVLTAVAVAATLSLALPPADALAGGTPGAELVVVGTVERFEIDAFEAPEAHADAVTFVNTAEGAVQVPASALEHVEDGATVRVGLADSPTVEVSENGVDAVAPDDAVVTAESADAEAGADVTAVQVLAEPAANVTDTGAGVAVAAAATSAADSPHQVLVVVATPSGGSASSVSAADVAATVNGSVDAYWSDVTDGAVGFVATAYPSVVTTTTTPCSSGSVGTSFTFWNEVKAKTGFTEGAGKHLLVYFKALPACGGIAGLGTIGGDSTSGGLVWSNGYNTTGVIGHELGHNLGLGHSQLLDCSDGGVRVLDALASACTERSYSDTNDIMAVSWQNQGHLNASHLRDLGILDAASNPEPSDDGQVTLAPIALGTGTRALTLTRGGSRYVLEYRAAVGRDAWMTGLPGWGSLGVTVRKEFDPASLPSGSTFSDRESFLLDGRPATPDSSFGQLDAALPVGVWIDLADGYLGVRVVSQDADGAVVEYRNGLADSDPRYVPPPRPELTVPQPWLRAGGVTVSPYGPVVPMRWSWKVTTPATDPAAAASVAVKWSQKTGLASRTGSVRVFTATATALDGTVVSARGATTATYRSDASNPTMKYGGSWTMSFPSSSLGKAIHKTTRKGAFATALVRGSSVGILLQRGGRNGWVAVYVDGVKVGGVNMKGSGTATRMAYVVNFGSPGLHRVTVMNASGGTYGRMGFDGVVTLS